MMFLGVYVCVCVWGGGGGNSNMLLLTLIMLLSNFKILGHFASIVSRDRNLHLYQLRKYPFSPKGAAVHRS